MKEIQVSQGFIAIVDDEDFELVSKYKWRVHKAKKTTYARAWTPMVNKVRTLMYMHRLIANSDAKIIDHINGNGLDNRRSNLRPSDYSKNAMNKTCHGSFSKYKGVSFSRPYRRWRAAIRLGDKMKHLGNFDTELEAAKAYDEAAKKHFGEYARLNLEAA